MKQYPPYTLKIKRLSKTKTVIIFRRNELDTKLFSFEDGKWVYNEEFKLYKSRGKLKLIVHNDNIDTIFAVDGKSMKIKGTTKSFGVFIRIPNPKLPVKAHGTFGDLEYYLEFAGTRIPYDNGTGITATRVKRAMNCRIEREEKTYPVDVPNSVTWSISHPFQGGRVSPK